VGTFGSSCFFSPPSQRKLKLVCARTRWLLAKIFFKSSAFVQPAKFNVRKLLFRSKILFNRVSSCVRECATAFNVRPALLLSFLSYPFAVVLRNPSVLFNIDTNSSAFWLRVLIITIISRTFSSSMASILTTQRTCAIRYYLCRTHKELSKIEHNTIKISKTHYVHFVLFFSIIIYIYIYLMIYLFIEKKELWPIDIEAQRFQ